VVLALELVVARLFFVVLLLEFAAVNLEEEWALVRNSLCFLAVSAWLETMFVKSSRLDGT
jgi:hypothetical protein